MMWGDYQLIKIIVALQRRLALVLSLRTLYYHGGLYYAASASSHIAFGLG